MNDASCGAGHAGPFCNVMTGACGNVCFSDAECGAGSWCNNLAPPALCQAKTRDGQPVPGGSCAAAIAARACVSGTCTSGGALSGTCGVTPDGGADAGDGGPAANDDAGDAGEGGAVDAGEVSTGDAGDATAGDASDGANSIGPDANNARDSTGPDASNPGDTGAGDTGAAANPDASDAVADAVGQFDATEALRHDAGDDGQTSDGTADDGAQDANVPEPPTPSAGGSIAGGGLSCSASPGAGKAAESSPVAVAFALLLLGARRRNRSAR
jgi:hypothetical protein